MRVSGNGINLIKSFESLRLKSYKAVPTEKLWTIGWGHYGVLPGLTITPQKAEELLAKDIAKAEKAVNKYVTSYIQYDFNQNQFDALVSFAFNIGSIKQLTANGARSKREVGEKMFLYNKSAGEIIPGLVMRRATEHKLYTTPC